MSPQSNKDRQESFRARKAMLEGAQEVRGIFLPKELHKAVKDYARTLLEHQTKEKK